MKVILGKYAGFCSGVRRAIGLTEKALEQKKKVYTLGPLIHNQAVVEELESKGIKTIGTLKQDEDAIIVIRSHGLEPMVLKEIKNYGYAVIDATCPYVRRAQNYVENLKNAGYFVVIVGEAKHPEVKSLLGFAGDSGIVYQPGKRLPSKKIGLVAQTTLNISVLQDALSELIEIAEEIKVYNTICAETKLRLSSALDVARQVDLMIVVGGKNSANTTHLAELCREIRPTHHIERADEIKEGWLKNITVVGVTAGTSTPQWVIEEVVKKLESF